MLFLFSIKIIAELSAGTFELLVSVVSLSVVTVLCIFLLFLPLILTLVHSIFQLYNGLIFSNDLLVMPLILPIELL